MLFQLADRWGEPDPRKLADMPADLLNHWRAFFMLEEEAAGEAGENTVVPTVSPDISTQCNDVMRILNG
ncbi:hypothetical protein OA40_11355 [Morganella morganii]|nr:hypothetical protein OA40_11355 [Morganella morganii]